MRTAAATVFPAFTESLEGRTTWPYLDEKGLVTVACGNLVDPYVAAASLPWKVDGRLATAAEVCSQWDGLKEAPRGRLAAWYESFTTIRLDEDAIDALVQRKAASNEEILRQRIPTWDALPANAQLATMSIAWACGAFFAFPKYLAALGERDWSTAAAEAHMDETGNKGLIDRNIANKSLLLACASVDADVVSWPLQSARSQ